jgi:hypothetical protein
MNIAECETCDCVVISHYDPPVSVLGDIGFTPFPTQRAADAGTIARAGLHLLGIGPWRVENLAHQHVDSPKNAAGVRPSHARPSARPSIPEQTCALCAEEEDERRPSWKTRAPSESQVRKGDLAPAQKAKLLVEYARLPTDKGWNTR